MGYLCRFTSTVVWSVFQNLTKLTFRLAIEPSARLASDED